MKILVIGHNLVVKEYQALWVSAAKQYRSTTFEILCPEVYSENGVIRAQALELELVPIHTLKACFARSGRQHLHFYLGLGRLLNRIRPDYVYCTEESNSLVTLQVARACGKLGIPYTFWTSLNKLNILGEMYGRTNIRRYLFPFCQSRVFATCAAAIATNKDAVEILRHQGYKGKIIPCSTNGVHKIFFDVGRKRIDSDRGPKTPFHIGFIGRLWNWKGVDILMRAFDAMKHRAQSQLSIRGHGEAGLQLRRLAKELGIASEVVWEPRAPYEQMPRVMGNLDVLVLPSLLRDGIDEKFGRVITEAMAAGAVGVGSCDGGIPAAMAGGGILFEPGDAKQLAGVLDRLCSDFEFRKEHQRKGFEAICRTHNYEVISRNLIDGLRKELGFLEIERSPEDW